MVGRTHEMPEDEVKKVDIIELDGKLARLFDGIDGIRSSQSRMSEDIGKIKEAVYNPDEGLYARLRNLEQWKETSSKITWVIMTSIIGLSSATVWHTFFK
jgi:hypothetical protein